MPNLIAMSIGGWIGIGIAVLLLVIILFYFVGTYNKLVTLRNRVKNQWAQVDVQLKKRCDLLPNLVETVKGYAKHEKETFENITKWRSAAGSASTPEEAMEANNQLGRAISKLLVTVEAYPELKANTNFLSLQSELKDIESKIAMARQFYNDVVLKLNILIERFPSNLVAGMLGVKQAKYFEIAEGDREVPKVSF